MGNRTNIKNIPPVADARDVELALDEHYLASKTASPPARDPANPPRRILVVDDDIFLCKLNCGLLIHSGYEVDTAADGATGWDALQAGHYDLLITDNAMPKVTGVEMVRMLRGQDATLPVILASGVVPTEELKRHPGLNISAILIKPYSIGEFLEAVTSALRAHGANTP